MITPEYDIVNALSKDKTEFSDMITLGLFGFGKLDCGLMLYNLQSVISATTAVVCHQCLC